MFTPADLFDLTQTEHVVLFKDCTYAWDALKKLKDYIRSNLRPARKGRFEGHAHIGEQVFIGEGTVIEDGVMIKGPAIIGRNCELRHNAYLREDVIIGDRWVIANWWEFKQRVVCNQPKVRPHGHAGVTICECQHN